jgi:hypothetical protein
MVLDAQREVVADLEPAARSSCEMRLAAASSSP